MQGTFRTVMLVLVFVAAFLVFNTALYVGLQVSPNLGSVLLIAAALIALAGVAWIVLSAENRQSAAIHALVFVVAIPLLWVRSSGIDPFIRAPFLAAAVVLFLGYLRWVLKSSGKSA